jgi:uncharacterized repeat protein (TIGR01451 family)
MKLKSLAFKSLVFKSLVFKSLAFKRPAFKSLVYLVLSTVIIFVELVTPVAAYAHTALQADTARQADEARRAAQDAVRVQAVTPDQMAADFRGLVNGLAADPKLQDAARFGANLAIEDYRVLLSLPQYLGQREVPLGGLKDGQRVTLRFSDAGFPAATLDDINRAYGGLLMGYLNQGQNGQGSGLQQADFTLAMYALAAHAQALKEQGEPAASGGGAAVPDRVGRGGPLLPPGARPAAQADSPRTGKTAGGLKVLGEWQYAGADPQSGMENRWMLRGDAPQVAAFNRLFTKLYGGGQAAAGPQQSLAAALPLPAQPAADTAAAAPALSLPGLNLAQPARSQPSLLPALPANLPASPQAAGPQAPLPKAPSGWVNNGEMIIVRGNFSNNASRAGYLLNGNAFFTTSSTGRDVVRLTDNQGGRKGSVFFWHAIPMSDQFSAYFETIEQSPNNGTGDGMAFVIQMGSTTPAFLGDSGFYLGYQTASPPGPKSIAIEIDRFDNSGTNDPGCYQDFGFFTLPAGHIGLDLNYSVSSVKTGCMSTYNVGLMDKMLHWWVDYNGTRLQVRWSTDTVRPADPTLDATVNLGLNGNAEVGFTAATGASANDHDVASLLFDNHYHSSGINPADGHNEAPYTLATYAQTTGSAGQTDAAWTVLATDITGAALPNRRVDFAILSGVGSLVNTYDTTDGSGLAHVSVTSAVPGTTVVEARSQGERTGQVTLNTQADLTLNKSAVGTGADGTVSSDDASLSCGVGCTTAAAGYDAGTLVTLTADPANGSGFTGWSGDCSGVSSTCEVTMNLVRTVNAQFSSYTLSAAKGGNGSGTVTSVYDASHKPAASGINCGAQCSDRFGPGSITLHAAPSADSQLISWSESACGTNLDCTVNLQSNKTVTANFQLKADLAVEKTAPADASALDVFTYTLDVNNYGPGSAPGVVVTDTLPSQVSFVSAASSVGSCSNNASLVVCSLGTLASAAAPQIQIAVRVNSGVQNVTFSNAAVIGGSVYDPASPNNSSTADVLALQAELGVSVTAPSPVTAGGTVTYTVTAANHGPTLARSVRVQDTLVGLATWLSTTPSSGCTHASGTVTCLLSSLANGASATYQIVGQVPAFAAPGAVLTSQVLVSSPAPDGTMSNNTASVDVTVQTRADLSVGLSAPSSAYAGSTSSITMTVSNSGLSYASLVQAAYAIPIGATVKSVTSSAYCTTESAQVTCSKSSLIPQESFQVVIGVQPDATLADGTQLSHQVSVSSSTTDPVPGNNSASAATTVKTSADLALSRTTGQWVAGMPVTYTLAVSNLGPSLARSVALTDTLPAGITYVSASPAQGSCSQASGVLTCALGNLALGASTQVLVNMSAPASLANNTLVNFTNGRVGSTAIDTVSSNNSSISSVTVTARSDLQVGAAAAATATAGLSLTYNFTVTNLGPSNAAGVAVSQALPAGVSYSSSSKSTGGACSPSGSTVTCSFGALVLGASATGQVVVSVLSSVAKGTLLSSTFTSSLSHTDPAAGNNTASAGTTVLTRADLGLSKSAAAAVTAGTPITYTWTVNNAGPSYAAGTALTDTLPAGLSFLSSDLGSCTHANGVVTCALGTVANGTNATARFMALAASSLAKGEVLANAAQVGSTAADLVTANNVLTATTTANLRTDLSLGLSGPASDHAGQIMTYTLALTNTGPSDSPDETLVHTLPADTAYTGYTASQGACSEVLGVVTCLPGRLANGAAMSLTISARPAYSLTAGTLLQALVQVSASNDAADPTAANNQASWDTTVTNQADISITLSGPLGVYIAYPSEYEYAVSNAGPSLARAVVLSETLPVGMIFNSASEGCTHDGQIPGTLTCTPGDIPPGTGQVYTMAVSLDQTLPDQTVLTSQVGAAEDTPDAVLENNQAALTTTVSTDATGLPADLGLSLSAPATLGAGGTLVYALTTRNYGPIQSNSTLISATLPAGMTYLEGQTTAGCTLLPTLEGALPQVECSGGRLQPGQSRSTRIALFAPLDMAPGTLLDFSAQVTGNISDTNLANNSVAKTTTTILSADLRVAQTAAPASLDPGMPVTYTIQVSNYGPSNAQDVVITDTLPAVMSFGGFTDSSGACTKIDNQITCSLPLLGPGEGVQITVVLTPIQGGTLTNLVQADSATPDPLPANNSSAVGVTVNAPVRQTRQFGGVEVTANVFQQVGGSVWEAQGDVRLGAGGLEYYRLAENQDVIRFDESSQAISGSGFVRLVVNDWPVFQGAFSGSFAGDTPGITPQNVNTSKFDGLGDFSLESIELSLVDLGGGRVLGQATIQVKQPKAQTVHITFAVDADGSLSGSVDAFTTTVAGVTIAVSEASISDHELSAGSVTVTLPAVLGGASGNVQQLVITDDSFSLGEGSLTFPLPDVKIGTGQYVTFVKNTATLGYNAEKGWFLTVGTTLQLTLPSNKKSYPFSYTLWVDSINGFSISGLLPSLNLDFAGFNLDLSNLNLSFDGFSVDLGKLKLPPLWGDIDLDIPFPSVGDFGIRFDGVPSIRVPSIKIGTSLTISDLVLTLDIFNGDYNFDLLGKLNINLPGNITSMDVNLNIDFEGQLNGTVAKLDMNLGGTTVAMSDLQVGNEGLSVEKGTVTLPARFGGTTTELENISIDGTGLHIAGGLTFKIPEIRIGDGSKVKFTAVTLTIRESGDSYALDGQATLAVNLPENALSLTVSFAMDGSGNLSGQIDKLALKISGTTLTLVTVQIVNDGLSVASATLELPKTMGGGTAVVKDVTIDAGGLHFGGGLTLDLPEVTFGTPASDKLRIKQLHATLTESGGVYLLQVSGTLALNLPSNKQDIAASFQIDSAGNLSGTVAAIDLNLGGNNLALRQVSLTQGGLAAASAQMALPAHFGGASAAVNGISVDAAGLHLAGGAALSLPDLQFGSGQRVRIQKVLATLGETGGTYTFAIAGTLALNLPSNSQQIAVQVKLDSGGNLSGGLDKLSLNLGGAVLNISQLSFNNSGLAASKASLALPASLGGSTANVAEVAINENGVSFGSGSLRIVLPDIKFGGGDKISVTKIQADLQENSGVYAFSAQGRLVINLPGNSQQVDLAFALDSQGKFSASLSKLTLTLAGSALTVSQVSFNNDGLYSGSVTLALPASLGSAVVKVASVSITRDGLKLGPGGVSVSIPDISLGTGGKVKIKQPTLTLTEVEGGYAFGASGVLVINIPSLAQESAFSFKIDTLGNIQGMLAHLEFKISGSLLALDNLVLGNKGFSVETAKLSLSKSLGSGTALLQNVTIDGSGLHIGSGAVSFDIPDMVTSGGIGSVRMSQMKAEFQVRSQNGQDVYGLYLGGLIQVRLPENSLDMQFSALVDSNGNFDASIDAFKIKMASTILSMKTMKITSGGLRATEATLGLALGGLPVEVVLKDVLIDGDGVHSGGGALRVSLPDMNIGSTTGFSLKGATVTFEVAGDKTYKATIAGTLRVTVGSFGASAVGEITLDSRGNFTGKVHSFSMIMVGMEVSAQNVRMVADTLFVDEAKLNLPAAWGGGYVALYNIEASPRRFAFTGGEFMLPEIKAGSVTLAALQGRLKKEGETWIIGAGGRFKVTGLGSDPNCGIKIYVEIAATANNELVATIHTVDAPAGGAPKLAAPAPSAAAGLRQAQPAEAGLQAPETPEGPESPQGVGLREVICGLENCAIPIGSTGMVLTRVEGSFRMIAGQDTVIRLKVTIASEFEVFGARVIKGDVDMAITPSPFKMDLAGAVTLLSLFHMAGMQGQFTGRSFSANIWVEALLVRGQMRIALWDQNGEMYLIGSGRVEVGLREGSLMDECVDTWIFGEVCITLPPWDIFFGVGADFGRFTNGAWGFKAYFTIDFELFSFDVGFYIDSQGNFALGNVSDKHLVTPPGVQRARELHELMKGSTLQERRELPPEDRQMLERYSFTSSGDTLVSVELSGKKDAMFALSRFSAVPDFSVIGPDGQEYTRSSPGPLAVMETPMTHTYTNTQGILQTTAYTQTIFAGKNLTPGTWQMKIGPTPNKEAYVAMPMVVHPAPALNNVNLQVTGLNQAQLNWNLTAGEPDTRVTIYANREAVTQTVQTAGRSGAMGLDEEPVYDGTQIVAGTPTSMDGSPSSYAADLSALPSGTYHLWIEVDDGMNPLVRQYAPEPVTVIAPWRDSWASGLRAEPGYRRLVVRWDTGPGPDLSTYHLVVQPPDGDPWTVNVGNLVSTTLDNLTPHQNYRLRLEGVDEERGRTAVAETITAVPEGPDVAAALAPGQASLVSGQGQRITATLSTTMDSFPGQVGLSMDNLPDGMTAILDTNYVTPTQAGEQVGLVLSTTSTLPGGVYTPRLVVNSIGEKKYASLEVTVRAPDFSLETSQPQVTLQEGQFASVPVSIRGENGFDAPVDLYLDNLPQGLLARLDPLKLRPGQPATLVLTDTSLLENGVYPLQVTGQNGLAVHTLDLSLAVNKPGIQLQAVGESRLLALPGETVSYTLRVSGSPGWTAPVQVKLGEFSQLPGASIGFITQPGGGLVTQAQVTAPADLSLVVRLAADLPAGVHPIDVQAESQGKVKTASVVVEIPSDLTSADLALQPLATQTAVQGGQAVYTLTLTNRGVAAAQDVALNLAAPAEGVTLLGMTTSQGSCNVLPGRAVCTIASLGRNASARLAVRLQFSRDLAPDSELGFTAQVSALTPDNDLNNNTLVTSFWIQPLLNLFLPMITR